MSGNGEARFKNRPISHRKCDIVDSVRASGVSPGVDHCVAAFNRRCRLVYPGKLFNQNRNARGPRVAFCVSNDCFAVPIVAQRGGQGIAQGIAVSVGNQNSEVRRTDYLGIATDQGRHHRQPAGHRLEKDVRPTFHAGRQDKDVAGRIDISEFGWSDRAEKVYSAFNTQFDDLAFELFLPIAFRAWAPGNYQVQVRKLRKQFGKRGDDSMKALALGESTNRDQDACLAGQTKAGAALVLVFSGEVVEIDTVADDAYVLGAFAHGDGALAQRFRDRKDLRRAA